MYIYEFDSVHAEHKLNINHVNDESIQVTVFKKLVFNKICTYCTHERIYIRKQQTSICQIYVPLYFPITISIRMKVNQCNEQEVMPVAKGK